MTPIADVAHVAAVLCAYVNLPETPMRAGPQDQSSARRLQEQGAPLQVVQAAMLLATLRRLMRPRELLPLSAIRSLAYFMPVIDELQQTPLPDGYLQYLRLKLGSAELTLPAEVQKLRFQMSRNKVIFQTTVHIII